MHWQTRLVSREAAAAAGTLRSNKVPFVSSGLVELPNDELGFNKGFLVRDPDGHVIEIVEK
jgi:hypothetical protein